MLTPTLVKYGLHDGVPDDTLALTAPTYADAEILPGDLKRLTGFGRRSEPDNDQREGP